MALAVVRADPHGGDMRDVAVESTGAEARPLRGLTTAEASRRLDEHGPNALPPPERVGLATRVLRELREPMALLLLVAATISGVALGELVDAVAIAAIVAINAVIALAQEGRAERALESLAAMEAPEATVVRDGRRRRVPSAEVVPGDVVVLQAGDRVPADLDLLESTGVEVDESMLTGESLPVPKRAGGVTARETPTADRDGRLHSGTLVTRGAAAGVVTETGIGTELGAIAESLRSVTREPTPLQVQLAGLTQRLGLAALVIAGAMFALTLVRGDGGAEEAFLTAVALAVAAVPEGLATVTTVALALGVRRMARRGAIVRRLPAVETLGATDVLVIDKTGTVTENRMRIVAILDGDGGHHPPGALPGPLRDVVEPVLLLCNDATLDPATGDPTEQALLELTDPDAVEPLREATPRLGLAPFTAERKRMSTLQRIDGDLRLLAKGAPEVLLPRCSSVTGGGGEVRPLGADERDDLLVLTGERAARGERVLALAQRQLEDAPVELERAEEELTLLGFVALRDPPRASAAASVEAVQRAGVTLLMATGDHPATASAIATEVGFDPGAALSGAHLRAEGLPTDPTGVPVFARVDPDQKLALVDRLQELGHTVAMTGDGVNDAPALQRADIGVALGATGSDVAREAADLVITDDDLGTIVAAIREGRGIYDNLRKVVDYLVSSNLAEVAVVVTTLLLVPSLGVPLFPLQLLWINLLTDGLPALALGVDPVSPGLMDRPPRDAGDRLLDGRHLRRLAARAAVLAAGSVGALLVALEVVDLPAVEARTVLFTTLVVAQVLYAFVVRRRDGVAPAGPNGWLLVAAATALVLQVAVVTIPPAQALFDTVTLSASGWLLALGAGALAPLLLRLAAGSSSPARPSPSPGGNARHQA